jgi:hypothetical protein
MLFQQWLAQYANDAGAPSAPGGSFDLVKLISIGSAGGFWRQAEDGSYTMNATPHVPTCLERIYIIALVAISLARTNLSSA